MAENGFRRHSLLDGCLCYNACGGNSTGICTTEFDVGGSGSGQVSRCPETPLRCDGNCSKKPAYTAALGALSGSGGGGGSGVLRAAASPGTAAVRAS